MAIIDLLTEYGHWAWLSLALMLLVIEVAAPGAFFLWIGLAAGATGLLTAVLPEFGWKGQLVVFAVLAVAVSVAGRRYVNWKPIQSDQPKLNRRGDKMIGREFVLDKDIVNGTSRLTVGESSWRIEGPDMAKGVRIRITGVEGSTLKVVSAE